MREIHHKAGALQSRSHYPRHRRIVLADQDMPRRPFYGDIDFTAVGAIPRRQLDAENRSAAWRVVEPDSPTESFHDLLDDAKTQAGSALLSRVGSIGLCEFFE